MIRQTIYYPARMMFCLLLVLGLSGRACVAADSLIATSAKMQLTLKGWQASGTCDFTLAASGKDAPPCKLVAGDLLTTSLTASEGLAIYRRDTLYATASKAGSYTASLAFKLKVENSGGERVLRIPVPQAGACGITLTIPGERSVIRSTSAVKVEYDAAGTHATVYPGEKDFITLHLSPGRALQEGALKLATMVKGALRLEEGVVYLDAEYTSQRLSGDAGELELAIPEGWVLERLRGAGVTAWKPVIDKGEDLPSSCRVTCTPAEKTSFNARFFTTAGLGRFSRKLTLPMVKDSSRASGTVKLVSSNTGTLSLQGLQGARLSEGGMALLEPESRFTLNFTPGRLLYTGSLELLASMQEHVMNVRGVLSLNFREGSVFHLDLKTSDGLRVVTLKGPQGMRWKQEGTSVAVDFIRRTGGRQTLEFLAEVSPQNGYPLPWVTAAGISQQSNVFAFKAQRGYEIIRPADTGRLVQVGATSLPGWLRVSQYALRGETIPAQVSLSIRRAAPGVEAIAGLRVATGQERALLQGSLLVHAKNNSLFRHEIVLGKGLDVSSVNAAYMKDWNYSPQTGVLQINLLRSSVKDYSISYVASLVLENAKVKLTLPFYRGATLMRGFYAFAPDTGLGVEPGNAAGVIPTSYRQILREYPQATGVVSHLAGAKLMFSYNAPGRVVPFAVDLLPTRLRLKQKCMVDFSPGLSLYTAVLNFDIQRGAIDSLRLKIPDGFSNAEISSTGKANSSGSFRSEDVWQDGEGYYRIDFPARLDRLPPVIVSCEKVLPVDGTVTVRPISVAGCDRMDGEVIVFKPLGDEGSFIDVQEKSRDGVERSVGHDSAGFQAADKSLLGNYAFVSAQAEMEFSVSSTGSRILQAAKISECELASRLTGEGNILTRLRCKVDNRAGQQFLGVLMPKGARVWGTFTDGKAVKVVENAEQGHLLVPLVSEEAAAQESVRLDLIYEQDLPAGWNGLSKILLQTPQLMEPRSGNMVQVDRMVWKMWVPEDYDLVSNGGTLQLNSGSKVSRSYLLTFLDELAGAALYLLVSFLKMVLHWLVSLLPFLLVGLVLFLIVRGILRGGKKKQFSFVRVLGLFCLVFFIVILPLTMSGPLMNARSSALRISSVNNLKQIGTALMSYRVANKNQAPVSLDVLLQNGSIDSKNMTSPLGGYYAYCGIVPGSKADDIVAVEILEDTDRNDSLVLFGDFHVDHLPNDVILQKLEKSQNYPLLSVVADHLQQADYASKNDGWNWGKKSKEIASVGREAQELQQMQSEIFRNQAVQTQNTLSVQQQKMEEFNRQQMLNTPQQPVATRQNEMAQRAETKSRKLSDGVRGMISGLNAINEPVATGAMDAFVEEDQDAMSRKRVITKAEIITDGASDDPDKQLEMNPDVRMNRGKRAPLTKSKSSVAAVEKKAREFQKEWLQSQSIELDEKKGKDAEAPMLVPADTNGKPLEALGGKAEMVPVPKKPSALNPVKGDVPGFNDVPNRIPDVPAPLPSAAGAAPEGAETASGAVTIAEDAAVTTPPVPATAPAAPAAATPAAEAMPGASPQYGFADIHDSTSSVDAVILPPDSKLQPIMALPEMSVIKRRMSGLAATGALPIAVDIPQNGELLEFDRGAASGGAEVSLFFFYRGFSIVLELVIALVLSGLFVYLNRVRPELLIPLCTVLMLFCIAALQWAQSSFKPQLSVALAVCLCAFLLRALFYLSRWGIDRIIRSRQARRSH